MPQMKTTIYQEFVEPEITGHLVHVLLALFTECTFTSLFIHVLSLSRAGIKTISTWTCTIRVCVTHVEHFPLEEH